MSSLFCILNFLEYFFFFRNFLCNHFRISFSLLGETGLIQKKQADSMSPFLLKCRNSKSFLSYKRKFTLFTLFKNWALKSQDLYNNSIIKTLISLILQYFTIRQTSFQKTIILFLFLNLICQSFNIQMAFCFS